MDKREYTEEEIRELAKKFYEKHIAIMFPPNIICAACAAENCQCNEKCINCGCQL